MKNNSQLCLKFLFMGVLNLPTYIPLRYHLTKLINKSESEYANVLHTVIYYYNL